MLSRVNYHFNIWCKKLHPAKLFTCSPVNFKHNPSTLQLFNPSTNNAFTLVETIMTLFIVGIVITASIMVFTGKHTANVVNNTSGAWQPCASARYAGLCTNQPVVLNPASIANIDNKNFSQFNGANIEDTLYSLVLGLDASNYLREYFATENKGVKITNHVIRTERATIDGTIYNNFYISSARDGADWIFPNGTISHDPSDNGIYSNVLIGNITLDSASANCHNNVIIGNNINANGNVNYDTVLGNNNIITGKDATFIFGNNNRINVDDSSTRYYTLIGDNIEAKKQYSLLIGQNLNAHQIQIGNNLYADKSGGNYTLTFADDVTINGQVLGVAMVPSDIRLKNIKSYYNKGLREILELEPVTFYYNNDKTATEQVGIIAQDLNKVFPEAVTRMPNGYFGVDTTPVFFASVNALKEINRQTVAEGQRANDLEKELLSLEKEISELNSCKANSFFGKIKCWFINMFNMIGGLL